MKLLIFSDKNKIAFQSKRQLIWLSNYLKEKNEGVDLTFAENFNFNHDNFDVILIHGYNTSNIKTFKSRYPFSKIILLNPGLLTQYHEIKMISKNKIKSKLQKRLIDKNIDAILVRSEAWANVVRKNTHLPVYKWIDFEETVSYSPKNKIINTPPIIGYHGNPFHLINNFKINGAPALEDLYKTHKFNFHILSNNIKMIKKEFQYNFPIKYFEYSEVDFDSIISNFDIGVSPTMGNLSSLDDTNVYIRNANRTISLLSKGIPSVTSPLPQAQIDLKNNLHTVFAVSKKEWFESIKKLLDDDTFYKNISENGYKHVKDNFCVNKGAEKLVEIIEKVLDGKNL
tara:strand:- start:9218 stop:10240 length:1023 start_codon:yes stop_codon:yes gene_type:complete